MRKTKNAEAFSGGNIEGKKSKTSHLTIVPERDNNTLSGAPVRVCILSEGRPVEGKASRFHEPMIAGLVPKDYNRADKWASPWVSLPSGNWTVRVDYRGKRYEIDRSRFFIRRGPGCPVLVGKIGGEREAGLYATIEATCGMGKYSGTYAFNIFLTWNESNPQLELDIA